MLTRKVYTTDLSDKEWQIIEPLLPKPKHLGRNIEYSRREILNAIFISIGTDVLAKFAQ
jgi:transposase